MNFRNTSLCVLFIALSFGAFVVFRSVMTKQKDQEQYSRLSCQTNELRSSSALERHPSSQVKIDVHKDLWMVKDGERPHIELVSEVSESIFAQKKGKFVAKENLEKISCTSSFGELVASHGTYEYPEYHFTADDVECYHTLGKQKAYRKK